MLYSCKVVLFIILKGKLAESFTQSKIRVQCNISAVHASSKVSLLESCHLANIFYGAPINSAELIDVCFERIHSFDLFWSHIFPSVCVS